MINVLRAIRLLWLYVTSGLAWNTLNWRDDSSKFGEALLRFLPAAGPAFVKLGQVLAVRPDFVGTITCNILRQLQDRAPFIDNDVIRNLLQHELAPSVYAELELEPQPAAAASIAQVYRARYKGKQVAVKVLRPGIGAKFASNLSLLHFCARIAYHFISPARRLKLSDAVAVIRRSSAIELNMLLEAAASEHLRSISPNVMIPGVVWQLCTKKVLVMDWIEGEPLHRWGHDDPRIREQVASKIAHTFLEQAFRHGFFHADLHPGNIFITSDNQVAFLDFGIVSFLSDQDRYFVAAILHAFIVKDYPKVADLHVKAGYLDSGESVDMFALACRSIAGPIMESSGEDVAINQLLLRLFDITADFNMEMQPQLLLLQKSMLVLEGIVYLIDPKINLWHLMEPWFNQWTKRSLVNRIKLDIAETVTSLQTFLKTTLSDSLSKK